MILDSKRCTLAVREVFLPHRVIASSDGMGTPVQPSSACRQRVGGGKGGTLHLSKFFLPAAAHRSTGSSAEALSPDVTRSTQASQQTLLQGTALPGSASPEGTASYAARMVESMTP